MNQKDIEKICKELNSSKFKNAPFRVETLIENGVKVFYIFDRNNNVYIKEETSDES